MQSASLLAPIRGILNILSAVGLWKILSDRGESGWKSLIPFYNTITFGKTCDEKPRAVRVVVYSILTFVMFFLTFALAVTILTAAGVITKDPSGKIIVDNTVDVAAAVKAANIPNGIRILLIVGSALFFLFAILNLVNYIKLHRGFDRYNGGSSAMILAWLFLPVFAYLYYAFMHKREMVEKPVVDGEL